MTLDDVKKKIHFIDVDPLESWMHHKRRAVICITAEVSYDRTPGKGPPLDYIDERLTREILRELYDDCRRELSETLDELHRSNPLDIGQWRATVDKLMKKLEITPPK